MNCQSKSIGGWGHLEQQCSHCFQGQIVEDRSKISKRAGSSWERWKRWKERREKEILIEQKKLECQHEWETFSDFQSYGYTQCKRCELIT